MPDPAARMSPIVITCPVCKAEDIVENPITSADDFQSRCLAFLEDGHAHAEGQLMVRGVPIARPEFAVRMTGQT